MGKGARKRQKAVQTRQEQEQARLLAAKKKKRNILLGIAGGVVALVVVAALVVNGVLTASGWYLSRTVSVISSSYDIDNAMMSYFFRNQYASYLQSNSGSSSGPDTTKSLKYQSYSSTQTWFDYFMSKAKSQVETLVILAEAAQKAGVALNDADKADIDETFTDLKAAAEKEKKSYEKYLASLYGNGVGEGDIRKCLELSSLATKYYQELMDGFTYSDEKLEEYFKENKNAYLYLDYKSYTLKSDIPDGATDDEKKTINAETKKAADELAACKTAEDFDAWLTAYMKKDPATSSLSDERIAEKVAATLYQDFAYSTSGDFGKWAFDEERKAGDTTVIEGTNQYTVYYLVKTAARQEYTTKNVRHILFNTSNYESADEAKAEADKILAQWESGEKTEAAFAALAKEHSEDGGSASEGGLYENVRKGVMVTEFNNWIFDDARKAGDVEIVKTSYGYHIMYFVGDGIPAWKAAVTEEMKNDDYEAKFKEFSDDYSVLFYDGKLNKINA